MSVQKFIVVSNGQNKNGEAYSMANQIRVYEGRHYVDTKNKAQYLSGHHEVGQLVWIETKIHKTEPK